MVQTPPGKKWLQLVPPSEPAKIENPEPPTIEVEDTAAPTSEISED